MGESLLIFVQIVWLVISFIVLTTSIFWKNLARFILVVIFLWASYLNLRTVLDDPEIYLMYANYAWFKVYQDFINGYFADHTFPIVMIIVLYQLLIGILLTSNRKWARLGGIMAIVFLILIAPLGIGSGFPSSLILAVAVYLVIRKPIIDNLKEVFLKKLRWQKGDNT